METNAQVKEKDQASKNKVEIVACLYSDVNFANRITDEIMAVSSDLSANEFASELLSKFRDDIFVADSKYLLIRKLNTKFNHFLTLKTDQTDFLEDGNVFNICSFSKNVGQADSVLFPIDKLLQMMPLETASDTDFRIQPGVTDSKLTLTSNQNDNVSSLDQNASTTDTPNFGKNPHLSSLLLPKPAADSGMAKLDETMPKQHNKDDNLTINPIDNEGISPNNIAKGVNAFNTSMSGKSLHFPSMIPTINPVHNDNAPSLQFSYDLPLQAHTTPKSSILTKNMPRTENMPLHGLGLCLSQEISRDDSIYSLIEPWMSESISKETAISFSPTNQSMKSSDNVNTTQRPTQSPKSQESYFESKNGHIPQKLSSVRVLPAGETDDRSGENCNFRNPYKPQEGHKNENIRGKSSPPSSRQPKHLPSNTSSLSRSPSVITSQQDQFSPRENRRSYGPRRLGPRRQGTRPGSLSNDRRSGDYGPYDNSRGKNSRESKQLDSSFRFPASTIAHLKPKANPAADDTDDKGSLSSGEIVD